MHVYEINFPNIATTRTGSAQHTDHPHHRNLSSAGGCCTVTIHCNSALELQHFCSIATL